MKQDLTVRKQIAGFFTLNLHISVNKNIKVFSQQFETWIYVSLPKHDNKKY